MKRILALLISLTLLLTLAVGCSNEPAESGSSSPSGETGGASTSTTVGDGQPSDGTDASGDTTTGSVGTDASGNTTTGSMGTDASGNTTTGNGGGTNATGNSGNGSTVTTTANKKPSSFSTAGSVKDLKGRTIRYGYNVYFPAPDATTADGKKQLARFADIEKKLNCKIVWNPKKQTHEQVLMGIASGTPEVDIIMSWGVRDLHGYYQKKYVTALDTLNVVDFSDIATYGDGIQYGAFGGHYYGVSVKGEGWNGIPLLFYNKAILKKAGYTPESLNKLQEEGKWTWDMFQTVLEKVKATGVEFPLSDGALYFYNMLMAANGTDWVSKKADGTFSFTADSPKAVEVMNYYKKLTQLGLIENSEAGDVSSIWYDINMASASRAAFWMSWVGMTEQATFPDPDMFGAMYPPKKNASSNYASANTTIMYYSVAAGVSKPEEVLTVLSEMVKPYKTEKEIHDARRAALTALVSDKYTLNNLLSAGDIEVFTNAEFATAANILTGNDKDGWNYQVAKIASGQMTMAQAIQAYKKVYNNRLKELFG